MRGRLQTVMRQQGILLHIVLVIILIHLTLQPAATSAPCGVYPPRGGVLRQTCSSRCPGADGRTHRVALTLSRMHSRNHGHSPNCNLSLTRVQLPPRPMSHQQGPCLTTTASSIVLKPVMARRAATVLVTAVLPPGSTPSSASALMAQRPPDPIRSTCLRSAHPRTDSSRGAERRLASASAGVNQRRLLLGGFRCCLLRPHFTRVTAPLHRASSPTSSPATESPSASVRTCRLCSR